LGRLIVNVELAGSVVTPTAAVGLTMARTSQPEAETAFGSTLVAAIKAPQMRGTSRGNPDPRAAPHANGLPRQRADGHRPPAGVF
jgi:hypothetical protein